MSNPPQDRHSSPPNGAGSSRRGNVFDDFDDEFGKPDGRPLHAYEPFGTVSEEMRFAVKRNVDRGIRNITLAKYFTLWSATHIQSNYGGGQLKWDLVFDGLGIHSPEQKYTYWLVEQGLSAWRRPLRRAVSGRCAYLYSLLAEGGLPEQALNDATNFRTCLLSVIRQIEREGQLGAAIAEDAAQYALSGLPQVLQNAEHARFLAELALAMVALRSAIPADVAPADALVWLEGNRAGWRHGIPLRLSGRTLALLVQPILSAERQQIALHAPTVRRELRRTEAGDWIGFAEIGDGAFVATQQLDNVAPGLVLRMVSEHGSAWRATPIDGGWELRRSGVGHRPFPIAPSDAVLVSVHADGRFLGQAVLDAGQPNPSDGPSLWVADGSNAEGPEVLRPLSGRGSTRSPVVRVLVAADTVPRVAQGLELGAPEKGPGGRLWPVRGKGALSADGQTLQISTGSDTDAESVRLVLRGAMLPTFDAGAVPVYIGEPQIFGAEGDAPLTELKRAVRVRGLPNILGGRAVEWIENGVVIARQRCVVLPGSFRLDAKETHPCRLRFSAEGLDAGWHIHLDAAEQRTSHLAGPEGRLNFELAVPHPGAAMKLRLSDPINRRELSMVAPWPTRSPLLVDASDNPVASARKIARTELLGWRGLFPPGGGTFQLRLSLDPTLVAFPADGVWRLVSETELISQSLALMNGDGRVQLKLVAEGIESQRLEIGHYDWESREVGHVRDFGCGTSKLTAVDLDSPGRTATTEVEGTFDVSAWLGSSPGLWYLQASNEERGVMRPIIWSAEPLHRTRREDRVGTYCREWERLLAAPDDADWERAWATIADVRAHGSEAGLDQVLAIARVPAVAVAHLLLAQRVQRNEALALETVTAIWWPTISVQDWAAGVRSARSRLGARLQALGMPTTDADAYLARVAGDIISVRPELRAHLGLAFSEVGLPPVASTADGSLLPLAPGDARTLLERSAIEVASQSVRVPEGAGRLTARHLRIHRELSDSIQPILQAPLIAAEVAARLREPLGPGDTLRLLSLRAAAPSWFDTALPAALTLTREIKR